MDLAARKTVILGAFLTLLGGCEGRDRLTFSSPGDGEGPSATILDPGQDTTVVPGANALVSGRVVDQDGIDTVYFDVQGGVTSFNPYIAQGADTVTFSLPLTTIGQSGNTITVTVSGVSTSGVHGDSAIRQITVQ